MSRLDRTKWLSVILSLLIVLSMPVAFTTHPLGVSDSHGGIAAADPADNFEGFEDGTLDSWSAGSITSNSISGSYAVKLTSSGSTGSTDSTNSNFPSDKVDSFQVAFKFTSNSGESFDSSVQAKDSGGSRWLAMDITMDGSLQLFGGSTTHSVASAGDFSTGNVYIVRATNINYTAETFDFAVLAEDGSTIDSVTGVDFQNSASDFSQATVQAAGGDNVIFDDIGVPQTPSSGGNKTIDGFVTNPNGSAVDGATIEVDGQSVTSGSDGAYSVEVSPPFRGEITASTPIDSATQEISVIKGETVTRNFTLANADIGGTVVACPIDSPDCSDPKPVANATVQVVAGNITEIQNDFADVNTAQDARDKAANITENVTEYDPDQFVPGLDPVSKFKDQDAVYPLVHERSDWTLDGVSGKTGAVVNFRESLISLSDPQVDLPAGEEIVISLWDPTEQEIQLQPEPINNEPPVDGEFPGSVTEGAVIIKTVGPKGEIIAEEKYETSDDIVVKRAATSFNPFAGPNRIENVRVTLSPGYYVISPTFSSVSYPIKVGNPGVDDLPTGAITNQTNKDDQLLDLAEKYENKLSEDQLVEKQTKTDSDGKWGMSLQDKSHIDSVTVFAMKAGSGDPVISTSLKNPGQKLTTDQITERPLKQLQDARNNGQLEGGVYLPSERTRIEVPGSAEVRMQKFNYEPLNRQNITRERAEQISDLLGMSISEVFGVWNFPISEDEREELFELANEKGNVIEEAADQSGLSCAEKIARAEVGRTITCGGAGDIPEFDNPTIIQTETQTDDIPTGGGTTNGTIDEDDFGDADPDWDNDISENITNEELRDRISELETIIERTADDQPDENTEATIENGTLTGEFQFDGNIVNETVSAQLETNNGTVRVIPEENITVEETINPIEGDNVVVDGVNVSNGTATVDVQIDAALEDEGLASASATAKNPAYPHQIPELQAIDISSLSPADNERVTLKPRPTEDSGFDKVVNATVFGPNGNELNTELKGRQGVRFTTAGGGVHAARITYQNNAGDTFVTRIPVIAKDGLGGIPPTIVLRDDDLPPIAADGVNNVLLSSGEGADTTDVVAVVPSDSDISELHIRGIKNVPADQLDVSVVKGSEKETVRKHVSLTMYWSITENTLLYRNDQAFTQDGELGVGEYDESDDLLRTFTTDQGQVTVRANVDPGTLDRVRHWADVQVAKVPFTDVAGTSAGFTAIPLLSGFGLLVFSLRRRWWT